MILELAFPVTSGAELGEDNGYPLYAAVCRALDGHLPDGVAVASIGGPRLGGRRIAVDRSTRLRLRTPAERVGALLALAGRFLDVGGREIGLGVPEVRALTPAPALYSRLVTIKGFTEPGPFLEAAARQMAAMGVSGRLEIPAVAGGVRAGLPRRRVVRIRGASVVGFAVSASGLSDRDSLALQEGGLGGRRRMGCGIFVPARGGGRAGHEA